MRSDREILSLVLRLPPGVSESLLQRFGNLRTLLSATPQELKNCPGVGENRAELVAALRDLSLSFWDNPEARALRVVSPPEAYGLFKDLVLETQEVVAAAFLNSRNRLICRREIFRGTISQSPGSPRDILSWGLKLNAAKLLLAHNHPSGLVEPSPDDVRFTRSLWRASRVVGILLVDHLIVAAGSYYSFAESGIISEKLRPLPPRIF